MTEKMSWQTKAKIVIASSFGLGLTSCGTTAVIVNETSVAVLKTAEPTAGKIAESNLQHISQICTEKVTGFITGSETIVQIGGSSAWSFCEYKNENGKTKIKVVSEKTNGKDENVILADMQQTADGKTVGYKDLEGNDHFVWSKGNNKVAIYDLQGNPYLLNVDESKQLDNFVEAFTGATGVAAAPETRATFTTEPPLPTEVPTVLFTPTAEATATPEFDLSKAVRLNLGDSFILDGISQKLLHSFTVDNYGYIPGPGNTPVDFPILTNTDYTYLGLVFEQKESDMNGIKKSINDFRYIDEKDGALVLVEPFETHMGSGDIGKKRSMVYFKVSKGLNEYNINVPRYGILNVEAIVFP